MGKCSSADPKVVLSAVEVFLIEDSDEQKVDLWFEVFVSLKFVRWLILIIATLDIKVTLVSCASN